MNKKNIDKLKSFCKNIDSNTTDYGSLNIDMFNVVYVLAKDKIEAEKKIEENKTGRVFQKHERY